MALPFAYTFRNVVVRRSSAALTAFGIAMTVAVFAGVLSLRSGFEQLYKPRGDATIGIYMRPGAASEGESAIPRDQTEILIKERPEIEHAEDGHPLAAAELFLAVYLEKLSGGTTNTPLRGIRPASIELQGDRLKLVEGRWLNFGTNEIVVGSPLPGRMANCKVGDTLTLNMTPFKVVGVFQHPGAEGGEIWGDVDRFLAALDRTLFSRVVARVKPGTDFEALSKQLEHDERAPTQVQSEPKYLAAQTEFSGNMLGFLAGLLSVIMGAAAVLGSINTMMASVAARTHEIGVLRAIGYSRRSIFLTFLFESALIGLIGGLLGLLMALPFDGLETGMANWNTFTDVSFAFRLTPELAVKSFVLAFVLGLIGGTLPALRAASLKPVEAFRQL
jgi:putative ABC transport system permease protein